MGRARGSGTVLPIVLPNPQAFVSGHSPQVQELAASLLIQANGRAGGLRWAGIPAVIFQGRKGRK